MEGQESGIMRKETILKEDGRYLIYYRFEEAEEGEAPVDRQPEAR